MRIEIWKQTRLEWQMIHKASPGNLQQVEDFLFSTSQMTTSPVVLAVKYGVSGDHKVKCLTYADEMLLPKLTLLSSRR